ncbi:hypothetical protein BU17DRAFT_89473 [Hysterangium stoloniferum]|nr:hypothetical protein BU17DRAFT_89473 [Hysterangium stoloniferum]
MSTPSKLEALKLKQQQLEEQWGQQDEKARELICELKEAEELEHQEQEQLKAKQEKEEWKKEALWKLVESKKLQEVMEKKWKIEEEEAKRLVEGLWVGFQGNLQIFQEGLGFSLCATLLQDHGVQFQTRGQEIHGFRELLRG